MCHEAACAHPGSGWWMKADGADIASSFSESVSGFQSGDVRRSH